MNNSLVYEVECQLDPDIVAYYDAWLPGHVQAVLACPGFLGAGIETPEVPPGERPRRRVRYRVESAAALDHYLENDAPRLRTETAQRFGERLQCAQCGQSADVHVLSMKEVAGDVTHSLLHLDSRVWRTVRLLVHRPGELTREFVAGRHQLYIPPFRLYLAVSILFFALTALLPDSDSFSVDAQGNTVFAPVSVNVPEALKRDLEAEGVPAAKAGGGPKDDDGCKVSLFGDTPNSTDFDQVLARACEQMKRDGGRLFAERFAATAPKLMFLFLPLMAAVARLFYWRPKRLYAEHLVLLLHNHAFMFLLIGVTQLLAAIASLTLPLIGALEFLNFLLFVYLFWYIYRSMRVVYVEGRFKTLLKYLTIGTIYVALLGTTMLTGLVYTIVGLS
ncbi:MAG: DUF4286 family protein [Gammaproteobacteria bacterium]|nr:DUF4286 family protein [Gammaproteobacteria bacterium]